MKNYIYTFLTATLLLTSCGGGSDADKRAELEELKKQQKEINDKIRALQAELNAGKESGKAVVVQTETVKSAPFTHYIEVQGRVDSDKNVSLSAKSQGTITRVYVTEGQNIRRGQVLAQIESSIVEQGIAELKTNLDFATNMYEKQRKLWEQKIGTEIQYLQAKSNKESLESRMRSMKEQLELTRIVAPFDGVVDEVSIRAGEVAMPGAPAIRIVNPSDFKVIAELAENYISKVKEKNPVVVEIPDLGLKVESKVANVSRVINPVNRTFMVEVNLPASVAKEVKANMIAYVNIEDYRKENSMILPVNVIQRSKVEGDYVFVAENGKAVKRSIKIGQTYGKSSEILEGLKNGEKVIVTGYQDLVDQQAIALNN